MLGALHVTSSDPSPGDNDGVLMRSGVTSTRTSLEGADASESPTALRATTVKECRSPLVRPLTSHTVCSHFVVPPCELVTRYSVMRAPLSAPGVKDTEARPGPVAVA